MAIFSLGAGVVGIATPPDGFTIRSFAFTAALVLTELIRWNYPFGGTPIATYAMVGVSTPFWITARTFGSPGLTVVVAWAGLAIGQLVQRRRDTVIAVGMVIALVVGGMLGSFRVETIDTVDVAVVQGGGPQNTRADVCTTRAVFERHMVAAATIDREVDLVVWPEDVVHPAADGRPTPERAAMTSSAPPRPPTAHPTRRRSRRGRRERLVRAHRRRTRQRQLLDRPVARRHRDRPLRQGPTRSVRRVRSPAVLHRELQRRDPRPRRALGRRAAILETDIGTLGISISWEIFFDHRARDAIGNGGQLLLNPTNGSSYWLTIVQSQQIASSRLRAVETGRFVLQAAPTGFSGIIAPDGEVLHRTGVSEQKVLYDTVELRTGRTLSVQLGAWPMLVYAIATLAVIQGRRRFRKVGESDLDPQGDGTVVHELDGHVSTEPTGGDDRTGSA